jgi:hypothetical protein
MKRQPVSNRRHSMRYLAAMMIGFCAISLADWPFRGTARSQNEKDRAAAPVAARPDDVKSIDAVLAALYDAISGPAGERDWDRLRSLFYPGARLIPCVRATQGDPNPAIAARVSTVEEYIKRAQPIFKANGFFEREIARRIERFGAVAHVFSTYESRHAANDPRPFTRGINSIQLFFDGKRWWAVTVFWDSEQTGQAIPEKYLPKE